MAKRDLGNDEPVHEVDVRAIVALDSLLCVGEHPLPGLRLYTH